MLVSQNSFMKRHVKGLLGYLSVKNSRVLKFDHDTQSLPTYLEACANIFIALSELMIIFWHHHSVLIVAQDSNKNLRRHFGLEIHVMVSCLIHLLQSCSPPFWFVQLL